MEYGRSLKVFPNTVVSEAVDNSKTGSHSDSQLNSCDSSNNDFSSRTSRRVLGGSLRIAIYGGFVFLLIGCSSIRPLYYWGNYEPVVYSHYSDKNSPTQEIEKLRKDERDAREENLPLNPGYHSYLGYLYYQVGNFSMANQEFAKEKKMFPESEKLMNRFLDSNGKR